MTLPTFLGIGAPRSGSTWITALLYEHPQVYIAPGKELFFFNRYYGRGLSWYESHFPSQHLAKTYNALGEFTPEYLYCAACPKRIAATKSISKLILVLRNPVNRVYSHYGLHLRSMTYTGSFEAYLQEPNVLSSGFYSRYLENFLQYFNREQILILLFERSIAHHQGDLAKQALADFLGISVTLFPNTIDTVHINRSYIPKYTWGYAFYVKMVQRLFRWNQHKVVEFLRQKKITNLFGYRRALPPMKPETKLFLKKTYMDEINKLSDLLGEDLDIWRTA